MKFSTDQIEALNVLSHIPGRELHTVIGALAVNMLEVRNPHVHSVPVHGPAPKGVAVLHPPKVGMSMAPVSALAWALGYTYHMYSDILYRVTDTSL